MNESFADLRFYADEMNRGGPTLSESALICVEEFIWFQKI